MSTRSVCLILVVSAVLTTLAFGQNWNDPNNPNGIFNFTVQQTPSYDYQGQSAEDYYLKGDLWDKH